MAHQVGPRALQAESQVRFQPAAVLLTQSLPVELAEPQAQSELPAVVQAQAVQQS
jgi:hypothetical protein